MTGNTMTKRNISKLMAILMVATLSLGFSSCSGSDDDDIDSKMVGTWTSASNENESLVFKSNGNCEKHYVAPTAKGVIDNQVEESIVEKYNYGTFTVNGTNFKITWNKEKVYKLTDGNITTEEETYKTPVVEEGTYSISDDNRLTLIFNANGYKYSWTGVSATK